MLDLYEELKTLISRLNAAKVEYALCGGLALTVYGIPRGSGQDLYDIQKLKEEKDES